MAYSWLFAGVHLFCHVVGHVLSFVPMLWLGYGGMPRRIQDYPNGYAGWHSVASFGHLIVVLGVFSFVLVLTHAIYFKRPTAGRHAGLPFISNRPSWLVFDKYVASKVGFGGQFIGIRVVREYLLQQE